MTESKNNIFIEDNKNITKQIDVKILNIYQLKKI